MVERFNRTLLNMLSIATEETPHNSDRIVPLLMMAYRSNTQETTKFTPFHMMFGWQINLTVDITFGTPNPDLTPCHSEYVCKLQSQLQNCFEI